MDTRTLSPLVAAGAVLALLLPPGVIGTSSASAPLGFTVPSPALLGSPKAELNRSSCTMTVTQNVTAAPGSPELRGSVVTSMFKEAMAMTPVPVGDNGVSVLTGTVKVPNDSDTGQCPRQVAGKLVVVQQGATPISAAFATPAPIPVPLLDPKGDDARVDWLYILSGLCAMLVWAAQPARKQQVTVFENPNPNATTLSGVQILTGSKWAFPGTLGTTLAAAAGLSTTIVATKLLTEPFLLDTNVYAAHVLIMGVVIVLASVVFNAASTPLAVRSSVNVPEEAERMRTTPVWALYLANALLSFGSIGLLLLSSLLVLDLHLAGLLPLWLGSVVAVVLATLAAGLIVYAVLYAQRMVREQGFQLKGFYSMQAAVNWGFDAKDVTPGRVQIGRNGGDFWEHLLKGRVTPMSRVDLDRLEELTLPELTATVLVQEDHSPVTTGEQDARDAQEEKEAAGRLEAEKLWQFLGRTALKPSP